MESKLERRQSFQTVAWFRDLYRRELLELDPPYQRRSVWNEQYREFFIETVLLQYPAPAIFVHEVISAEGAARYSIVDGKQRLNTLFDFADDLFPVGDRSILTRLQGKFFSQLDDDTKKAFWTYQFSVEYLPTVDESTLTNVFDRINRNVARLTRQELRHARFDGLFATQVERLADFMEEVLPNDVPRIVGASKRQMKDIELVAQLLLLLESGPQSFSQDDLDEAYSARDQDWDATSDIDARFRRVVDYLRLLYQEPPMAAQPVRRLRNQADFYSLFGSIAMLQNEGRMPEPEVSAENLLAFCQSIQDAADDDTTSATNRYTSAARSASNDLRQRTTRIDILTAVILGEL